MNNLKQKRTPEHPPGCEPLQWSPFSRSCYTVEHEGEREGIGAHPVFDVVPGAWNLLWLSWPGVDDLIYWAKDPGQFPYHVDILPIVVATCMQMLEGGGSFGVVAECLTPLNFLKFVSEEAGKANPPYLMQMYGSAWVDAAMARARAYKQQEGGAVVIPFDLSRRRQ